MLNTYCSETSNPHLTHTHFTSLQSFITQIFPCLSVYFVYPPKPQASIQPLKRPQKNERLLFCYSLVKNTDLCWSLNVSLFTSCSLAWCRYHKKNFWKRSENERVTGSESVSFSQLCVYLCVVEGRLLPVDDCVLEPMLGETLHGRSEHNCSLSWEHCGWLRLHIIVLIHVGIHSTLYECSCGGRSVERAHIKG